MILSQKAYIWWEFFIINSVFVVLFFYSIVGNKANKDFTQGILDIEDLVELGKKHRCTLCHK